MKVGCAAQVLSETVVSALEILYEDATLQTSKFIQHKIKFFDCLNTWNEYEGIRTRYSNLQPYRSVKDERLNYLLYDFLQFLKTGDYVLKKDLGTSQRHSEMQ